jgi:hypothetical protein
MNKYLQTIVETPMTTRSKPYTIRVAVKQQQINGTL